MQFKASRGQRRRRRAGWWTGTLPTRAWRDRAEAVIAFLPTPLVREIAGVYAVVDSWNGEREAARGKDGADAAPTED
jgi:hypothetical protein